MPPLPTFLRKSFLTTCRDAPKTCSEIAMSDGLKIMKTKIAPVRSYLYESGTLCPRTATIQRLDREKRFFAKVSHHRNLLRKLDFPWLFSSAMALFFTSPPNSYFLRTVQQNPIS